MTEFTELVSDIFERRFVSNFSRYCTLLEERSSVLLGQKMWAVTSCDIGMTLAWRALGLRSGEVIVPSYTFVSTVNAIVWNGLTPVFADIDPRTLCVCPDSVRRQISPKTVAIAAVHMFGEPVGAEIDQLAAEFGLHLLFDGAHVVGSTQNGVSPVGRGDVCVVSLSGTKPVTAGEGGLSTFRDPHTASRFLELRGYGFVGDYNAKDVGLNGKISELDAALGYLSFGMLDEMIGRRMKIAAIYRDRLESTGCARLQPRAPVGDLRSYKDLVVVFNTGIQRATVVNILSKAGVETRRYFLPVHTMDAYRHLGPHDDLRVTESVWDSALCLPIYHDLEDADVHRICDLVDEALGDVSG